MNTNIEFLNYIHQNAEMGISTIGQLTKIAEDKKFLKHLKTQLAEYESIDTDALSLIHQQEANEKNLNPMAKVSAYMNIKFKTLMDKTPSHISEMMMQGSIMGIIDITKNLKKYDNVDEKIKKLANKLLHTEEANIEHLKAFL